MQGDTQLIHFCSICCYKSVHSSNVNRHVRRHTGEKPFACDLCLRSFSRSDLLAGHLCAARFDRANKRTKFDWAVLEGKEVNNAILRRTRCIFKSPMVRSWNEVDRQQARWQARWLQVFCMNLICLGGCLASTSIWKSFFNNILFDHFKDIHISTKNIPKARRPS